MCFLVLATDAPGIADIRAEVRPIHRACLRNPGHHQVRVHLGGPTLTTRGEQTNGILLVVEADNLAAVSECVADDPYAQAGVFRSNRICAGAWTLGAPVQSSPAEALG